MAIVTPVETPPGERRRLRISSPVSGETLSEIAVATAGDVRAAVERARKAQPEWAGLGFEGRALYLRRAQSILVERQDEFVDVVLSESGKPRSEALMMEIFAGCDVLAYYAKRAQKLLRPERRRLHGLLRFTKRLRIEYRPLGVVGVISPWNGPFILGLNPTVQALIAGNAVVLKPAEVAPASGQLGVDKIAFTGSVSTGRKVAEACARQLIPCTLELGGKDPMIVCEDANLESAAAGAIAGAFMNTGQYCCGTERVYVVDSVADDFVAKVVERASRLRQGADGDFDVGSLFWPHQLEVVDDHVNDAVARGARVLVGGRRNPDLPGLFYEPTVLVDVNHDMLVMQKETFGPVLPIMRVRDEEEAIRMANDSSYGLSSSVWTRDGHRALEIARRIESGSVCVNDMSMTFGVPEAPFGGLKHSGIGQVNGETGLKGYCHALPVLIDRFGGRQARKAYPYSSRRDAGLQRLIRLLYGTSLSRWLS
jgi:succinate-semialdehyde dehydrogenase/glutarate-semialdehyde dehydrogenase